MNEMKIKVELNVCRVCLQNSNVDFESLFDETKKYGEKFKYSTSINIDENDGLPKSLCPRCIRRMKISCEFKKQCELTDKHFRDFLSHINTQFLQDVPINSDYLDDDEADIHLLTEEDYDNLEKERLKGENNAQNDTHDEIVIIEQKDEYDLDLDSEQQAEHQQDNDNAMDGIEILGIEDDDEEQGNEEQDEEEDEVDEENEDEENSQTGITADEESTDVIYVNLNNDLKIEDIVDSEISTTVVHHLEIKNTATKTPKKTDNFDNNRNFDNNFCQKCDKKFSSKQNLLRHMQTHDGSRPYQCMTCGRGFTQNGSLKQHMCIHTGERPFKCGTCGRGFTQSKSLQFHMRRHTGEKPFTCEKCGLAFRQKDGLKRHNLLKHSEQKILDTYICDICHKVLHSKYSLQVHIKKHQSSDNTFDCDSCSRSYQTKTALVTHKQRTHTGEKPFKCGTCGKVFSQKASLLLHVKQHMSSGSGGENESTQPRTRKLGCSVENCDKMFDSKRLLAQHEKTHEPKEFTEIMMDGCNYCQIPFVNVEDLNEHMLSCPDAIDVKCDYCSMNFQSNKAYEEHLTQHGLIMVNE